MLGIFSQWCSYPYLPMPFSAFEMFKFERDFHVAFTNKWISDVCVFLILIMTHFTEDLRSLFQLPSVLFAKLFKRIIHLFTQRKSSSYIKSS